MERETFYSLCFFDKKQRDKLRLTDTSDPDAIKNAGFTVAFHGGVPYFEEAILVCVCKKLYEDELMPEKFADETGNNLIQKGVFPRVYLGAITAVLKKKTVPTKKPTSKKRKKAQSTHNTGSTSLI